MHGATNTQDSDRPILLRVAARESGSGMREPYAVKVVRTVLERGEDDNIFSQFDEGMIRQGDRAQANYVVLRRYISHILSHWFFG
ncbi:MAG: hypothetical protein ACOYCB_10995 [Fastidiosipilaceae bacterium]|jgi:hypothetical protein